MPKATALVLLFLIATVTFAQTPSDSSSPLDGLPGYWQFTHDDPLLGTLAAGGTLANLAPLFLPVASSGSARTEYWVERGGLHYFAWNDPAADGADTLRPLKAGVTMAGIWGGFFSVYGGWDAAVKSGRFVPPPGLANATMGDFLAAPYQAEHLFNYDVFPVYPLLAFAPLTMDDWKKLGGYFHRDRVDFLGARVTPPVGLGLTAAGALTLVAANAALEEISFRGMLLSRMGVVGSSLYFGANHLINPFALSNFSFEEAGLQATFATLFGLYAGDRTVANGGDFRRMIALHYWHNVTSLVLAYLIDPDHSPLFQITVSL